jgi:hypothetical protein
MEHSNRVPPKSRSPSIIDIFVQLSNSYGKLNLK